MCILVVVWLEWLVVVGGGVVEHKPSAAAVLGSRVGLPKSLVLSGHRWMDG